MTDDARRSGGPLGSAFQIYAPSTVYAIGVGAMSPAVATAALDFSATPAMAAAVVTMLGVGMLITTGPAALLTSRVGERQTLILSAVIGAVGSVIAFGAVARWHGLFDGGAGGDQLGLALLVLAVTLMGASGAGFNLARQSYLAAAVPLSHRARAMSLLGGTLRIGTLVGPFAGAGLQTVMGLSGAFAVTVLALLATVVMSFFIRELPVGESSDDADPAAPAAAAGEVQSDPDTLRRMAWAHRRLLSTVGLCVLALSAGRAARTAIIPLWGAHLGLAPATTSLIYGLVGLIDVLMFYPAGWLMDRYGRRAVAVPCLSVMALGVLLMPFTSTPGWFLAAALLVGLGNGFGAGIVLTLGADYAPPRGRAKFLGVWRTLADSGVVAGPLLVSLVAGAVSLGAGVWVLGGLLAAGAVGFRALLPPGPGTVNR
ncbi:MAG: MFS transporter [Micrococcus sp.]|nr:MFS transporter [Micrococcus sp.]